MKRLAIITTALLVPLSVKSVDPRWGHRAAYIESSQRLIVHGGKSDPTSSYSYTSAPNTGETLSLDLSTNSSTVSVAWKVIRKDGPTVAWHTLDFLDGGSEGELLVTGGDGGSALALQTRNDSTWIISPNPSFTGTVSYQQETNVVQPIRKVFSGSSRSVDGKTVFITGGEKNDGSGLGYKEAWAVASSNGVTYTSLPDLPTDLVHHQSVMLANGTLILIGGLIPSASSFLSLSSLYTLDTTKAASGWNAMSLRTSTDFPTSRRGHTATLVTDSDGNDFIYVVGGISGSLQGGSVLDDIWRLDVAKSSWEEVSSIAPQRKRAGGDDPSARFDHIAVAIDQQLLVFGGYGSSGPADDALYILDTTSATWIDQYQAPLVAKQGFTSESSSSVTGSSSTASQDKATTSSSSATAKENTTVRTATATKSSGDPSATAHPEDDEKKPVHKTAIALGATFGALALIALILGACLLRRRRKKAATRNTLTPFGGQPLRKKRFGNIGRGKRVQPMSEKLEAVWDASEKDDIFEDGDGGVVDYRRYRQSFGYEEGYTKSQEYHEQGSGNTPTTIGLGKPLINNIAAKIRQVSNRITSNPKRQRIGMLEDEDREDLLWKGEGQGSDDEEYDIHTQEQDPAQTPFEDGEVYDTLGSRKSWPSPPERADTYKTLPPPPRSDDPGTSPVSSSYSNHLDEFLGNHYNSGIMSYVQNGSTSSRRQPLQLGQNSRDSMTESMMAGAVQHARKVSLTTAEANYVPLGREESWLQRVTGSGVASLFRSKQGAMQRTDEAFLDPTTPPILESIRENGSSRSSDNLSVLGNFGQSVASAVSAATSNSTFLERYGQMNILQREAKSDWETPREGEGRSSTGDAALPSVPSRREIPRPATPPRGPRPAPLRMPTHIDVGSGPNRRPVKDIAASINRRGTVVHDDVLPRSPLGQDEGRPAATASISSESPARPRSSLTGPRQAQVIYQAAPRAPFAVTNNL